MIGSVPTFGSHCNLQRCFCTGGGYKIDSTGDVQGCYVQGVIGRYGECYRMVVHGECYT